MLSKRLEAILNWVPENTRVVDIGCDHAYLPIQLVRYQRVYYAIGCDINEQPLKGAQENINRMNIDKSKIELRLGSGFTPIKPHEVDVATIAGMGGSLMVDILEKGKTVVQTLQCLIVSPNIAAWRLRQWAMQNQFCIVDEQVIEENGRYYEILCLEPTKDAILYSEAEMYFGPLLLRRKDEVTTHYFYQRKANDERLMKRWERLLSERPGVQVQYKRYQKLWREWEAYQ